MDLLQIGLPPPTEREPAHEQHIDPVCGMTVDPGTAAGSFAHQGTTYYFCAKSCLQKFQANPAAYLDRSQPRPERRAVAGATYTCPMHPEVVQDHPGACPKCGMALEPMMPTAEQGPDP